MIMGTTWTGLLAPLDVSTGDGRRFLSSGVTARELPLPLKWQRVDAAGHDDSVIVGSLESISICTVRDAIDNGLIKAKCVKRSKFSDDLMGVWGTGQLFDDIDPLRLPRLAEDVEEAKLLLSQRVIGPSVDAGSCEAVVAREGSDTELTDADFDEVLSPDSDVVLELLFTEYQIAAATLVAIPAFAECRPFQLMEQALTAAVRRTGWEEMPLAERDMEWDRVEAERRVAENAGIGGDNPDWARYAQAHLYQDMDANPETKGAYGFPIVDIDDGTQRIVPRAVFTTANVLNGGMGGTNIPQTDQDAMKKVVEGLYDRMAQQFDDDSIVAPWLSSSASSTATADLLATVTAAAAIATMADPTLFDNPRLDRLTPITVTDDGHVFGHIATHDVCHVGIPGTCTTAPVNEDGYNMFHRYQPDGIPVTVGRITTGGGKFRCTCRQCGGRNDDHACLKLTLGGTIAHHDEMSTVAWVRAGEDTTLNAVWVSGVIAQDASVEDLAVLARQRVSGDWRPSGADVTLVEVLALAREEPGFPLPRVRLQSGHVSALTAAGVVRPVDATGERPWMVNSLDYDRLADALASRLADGLRGLAQPTATVETEGEPTAMSGQGEDDGETTGDERRTATDDGGQANVTEAVTSLMEDVESATLAVMASALMSRIGGA